MKLFDLTGKVAIVTGGNGGIGLGIAQGLAEAGAKIVVARPQREKSQAAAARSRSETGVDDAWPSPPTSPKPEDVDRAVAEVLEPVRPDRHPLQQRRHQHPQAARRS